MAKMNLDIAKLDHGARVIVAVIWVVAFVGAAIKGGPEKAVYALLQALVWTVMFMLFYMVGKWIYLTKRGDEGKSE